MKKEEERMKILFFKKILTTAIGFVFFVNSIAYAAPIHKSYDTLRPVSEALSGGLGIEDNLKTASSGMSLTEVSDVNLKLVIERISTKMDEIRLHGGFVFDIDDTLLTSVDGRPETLYDYPSVLSAICDLLIAGYKISISSQTSYYEQAPRVVKPIVDILRKKGQLEAIKNFTMYTASGASKRVFNISRGRLKTILRHNYTDKHKIGKSDLGTIRNTMQDLLSNWEEKIVRATSERLSGISEQEQLDTMKKLGVSSLDYETLRGVFLRFQNEGIKKKFKNADMPHLKGKKPPLRIYNEKFPPNDTSEAAPWIEFRDEVMIALRVAAFEDKDYPVFRDTMIHAIKNALGMKAGIYDIRPGGTSTIDISKAGVNKAASVSDIIRLKRSNKNLLFFAGDKFKNRESSDGVVLNVLPAENCLAVGGEGVEINEALRIGADHGAVHKFILAVRNMMYVNDESIYESLRGADKEQALAARINGHTISEAEHRGEDGYGGINKIARIEILAYRASDLKQGRAQISPRHNAMVRADANMDYDLSVMEDRFFDDEIKSLLEERIAELARDENLITLGLTSELVREVWDKWTIRLIPNWRKNCRRHKITDDIIEHYGRKRFLTLLDYNDYVYLKAQDKGGDIIAELLMHGFVHILVNSLEISEMSQSQIEDFVVQVAPVSRVKQVLNNIQDIDNFSQQSAVLEQRRELDTLRGLLDYTVTVASKGYSLDRYDEILKNLRHLNLKLNYMQVIFGNESYYGDIVKARHELVMRISKVFSKHLPAKDLLREQFFEDIERYIKYAVESGVTTMTNGENSLHAARENIQAWLSPENRIPEYIKQGLLKGMLEGRSEDIIYNYGSNAKRGVTPELKGWKEFGTAGIRNEAVQSSSEIIRQLELDEFARHGNDPRVSILTGPYLINSVSLLKQAMTIIKLASFMEYKLEHGVWPDEVKEEARKWPDSLDEDLVRNLKHKTVTIAYDSRLNGRYFAYLLAAVFLENGFKVNIFDNPAGVPGGVIVSNGAEFFGNLADGHLFKSVRGSLFGILVSASHSEAWFNGFKVFLGHLRSQVDSSMKAMLKDVMGKITYDDIPLEELGGRSISAFEDIFEKYQQSLYWLGTEEPIKGFNYCGGQHINFYGLYYDYLKKRSAVAHIPGESQMNISKARNALKILYTAFFGVGAVPAANYPDFLQNAGYNSLDIVNKQTKNMDGRFPGHLMPDPGVPEGWMSNLWDYIKQNSGENFSNLSGAIELLNSIEIGAATDPDIDRGGIMLGLPDSAKGNIKDSFLEWVDKEIDKSYGEDAAGIKSRVLSSLNNLNDKLLLTANDAWSFIAYYTLKVKENTGTLDKDRLYIIEKSHVTTSMLNNIANHYRDKGYNVFVVDTYVGFTDLGKKSRDLFSLAKSAWDLRECIVNNNMEGFASRLDNLKQAYALVKERVPYETAGIGIVDGAIQLANDLQDTHKTDNVDKLQEQLGIIAHMDILMGVEESNGYGELGRYNPEIDKIENAHIADKDGSLGLYQFLELVSYGRGVLKKSAYEMYADMLKELGWVATDNQFLLYPGFQGNEQKAASVSAIEKILPMVAQRMLDHGKSVSILGKYDLDSVVIYRDEKCDSIYLGFPEEGTRFNVVMPSGNKGSITYRASGTGNNNRNYNWIQADKPKASENIEDYRNRIRQELGEMILDFFGQPADTEGKIVPSNSQPSFLLALRNAVSSEEDVMSLIANILGIDTVFTPEETKLYRAVINFIDNPDDEKVMVENEWAWRDYLASEEAVNYPVKIRFFINSKVVEIPNAAAMAWQASLVNYLSSIIRYEARKDTVIEIACDDPQIAEFAAKRTKGLDVKIVPADRKSASAGLLKPFGKTGFDFFPIGLGTIWFGREWPMGDRNYVSPSDVEIERHLMTAFSEMGNRDGLVMIDTAAAYGLSERKIGGFFRKHPDFVNKAFIATKWGERFDIETGRSVADHSVNSLLYSLAESRKHLPKIDLFYIHKATVEVLQQNVLVEIMKGLKTGREAGIKLIGVSISDAAELEKVIEAGLLEGFDVLQTSADVARQRRDLIEAVDKQGIAIVINSPVRKAPAGITAKSVYQGLLNDNKISMVLTGTRHHLEETIEYIKLKSCSSGLDAIELRQQITTDAGKMLEQIRQYTGLPVKTDPAALRYLAIKDGFFENWDDVFNYFAHLEFETPVYQVRDVKTFGEKPVSVFAGHTGENGIAQTIATVDEVKDGKSIADKIEPATIIRANADDRAVKGALNKAEIRPVSALSVAMIDPTATAQTSQIEQAAYYMQRGVFASRDDIRFAFENPLTRQRFDITVMRPGAFGKDNELLHTSGHYHKPKWKPEIYQVVYGKAAYLLQKTREPLESDGVSMPMDIEKAIMVEAEAGEPVVILPGYGHVTTNLSLNRPLVMVNWLTWDQSSQYGAFIRGTKDGKGNIIGVGGGSWYAVEENGNVAYKPNPNVGMHPGQYHHIPDLEIVKPAALVKSLGLKKDVPIYSIVNDKDAFLKLARYLNEPLREEFRDITAENAFEFASKSSSAGHAYRLASWRSQGQASTSLDELLGRTLSDAEAITWLLNYSYIPEAMEKSEGIAVYSDTLKESPALQEEIRNSQASGRRFFLANKEHDQDIEFLKDLGIDKSSFEQILPKGSKSASDFALAIAATMKNNGIKRGKFIVSSQEDLEALKEVGFLIEALVLLLKDKRFEIISDYSQQHMDYIRTHKQALVAA
jgi:aryl-alcohol dehydrogenase-like predicted oxidoreductase/oxalate decarboxylase/phosphoglucose isomerase-like protein (cupin superfamily)